MLSTSVHRGQRVTDSVKLELWAAPWMLGTEPAASARVANARKCSASPPAPHSWFNDQWETTRSQTGRSGVAGCPLTHPARSEAHELLKVHMLACPKVET